MQEEVLQETGGSAGIAGGRGRMGKRRKERKRGLLDADCVGEPESEAGLGKAIATEHYS